jgi:acetoin utilization protein AcuB
MRVQDVMSESVRTVSSATAAEEAWALMRANRIRHLVVVNGRRIVGILSDRDGGGRQGAAIRRHRTVADLMTEPVVTTEPATTVRRAANLMRGRSIGCLVVVTAGRVKGIVTVSDLLELVGRGLEKGVTTGKRWTLKHRVPHRKTSRSMGTW